jgi:minor extracellular protease Epr
MTRMKWFAVAVGSIVLVALLVGHVFADGTQDRRKIVVFQPGTPESVQTLVVTLSGSQIVQTLSLINAMAIELPVNGTDDALTFLLGDPNVAAVYDDLIGRVNPIITLSPDQEPQEEAYGWGPIQIHADSAHQEMPTQMGSGVKVAILDTGIDAGHPELANHIVGGYSAIPLESSYADQHGHGTFVAGIIAAALNGEGMIGVAPEAGIVAVKVLGSDGSGRTSAIIKGLEWVCNQGIRLVNLSLGFSSENPPLMQATQRFKQDCSGIMVAASGNYCSDEPGQEEGADSEGEGCTGSSNDLKVPARYLWVIAVGATNIDGEITSYSLTGDPMRATGVVAPGGERSGQQILSTAPNHGFALGSGTSAATPHVTGAVALLLQGQPGLSFEQVLTRLQQTARDLGYADVEQGGGEIDVQQLTQ